MGKVLEEAKTNFISATLNQQEQLQRDRREKKELQKRTQWLKNRLKGMK